MQRGVLLDTGPLVAYFCPSDRFHAWAVSRFYIALPLAFIAMGTLAAPLLALDGWYASQWRYQQLQASLDAD